MGDGQVIAQMDSRDAAIAVQQTEASVGIAQATLAASEAQALQAQRTLDRSQKLEQTGAISREALLDARAARDNRVEAARGLRRDDGSALGDASVA